MSSSVTGTPLRPGADARLSITGMMCAACAASVQTKLNAIDGVTAARLARATLTVIRRNLAWAFGYNVAARFAGTGTLADERSHSAAPSALVLPEEETALCQE